MRCPFTFTAFGLFLMLSAGAEIKSAEHPHPFTVHDLLAMDRIDDPRVSSDGKTIFAATDNLGQHSLFAVDVGTVSSVEWIT